MEYSPGLTIFWATKQALVNFKKLISYQSSVFEHNTMYEIINQLQEKKTVKKNTNVEVKQHATKQLMGSQNIKEEIKKVSRDK